MWSDQYNYLNIYHDSELSVHCSTRELVKYLKTLPELKQTDKFKFSKSLKISTFFTITLLHAKSLNSWDDRDTNLQKTNLIVIVCSKRDRQAMPIVESLFIKIASFLNWQLVVERTDDRVDNWVMWAPAGSANK